MWSEGENVVVFSHRSLNPVICEVIIPCDLQIPLMNPAALLWLLSSDGLSLFFLFTTDKHIMLSVTIVVN